MSGGIAAKIAALIFAAATITVSVSGGSGVTLPESPDTDAPPSGISESTDSATSPTPDAAPSSETDAMSPGTSPTPTPSPTPSPSPSPSPAPPEITVAVGGDVLPLGRIGAKVAAGEYDAVLDPGTAERLRAADVTMINLETSVSTRGSPIPDKAFTFRSPPENLSLLTEWLGADVVSLANNHTLDYGWDAFYDTLTHIDNSGMARIGAGADVEEAARPYIYEKDGLSVAFFAANQILPYTSWQAGPEKAGQLIARDPKNLGALGSAMARAREFCDYIVVYMHWGIELDKKPYERQVSTARALIDAGADVVIGAHPHIVQSFEFYKGKPIIYSVGNFLFNALNPDTVVIFLSFGGESGGVRVEALPARTSGTLTSALDEEGRRRLFTAWENISSGVTFSADGAMLPID
jgi:poly-gamma-glutamate synthesis protein (capsule biosynthesis protein)